MNHFVKLQDIQQKAYKILPPDIYDFIAGGAGKSISRQFILVLLSEIKRDIFK